MTTYDDPNRQAVGLEPIWTGAGEEVAPQKTKAADDDDKPKPSSKAKAKDG